MKKFEKVKNIHFIGIGGAGMIGIAKVLLKKGYIISGSDINFSDDLKKLENDGATVYKIHASSNVIGSDLVVISSAISKDNPEILKAKEIGITIIPRAEMLGSIMIGYDSIAVAGSHGKTTTTSMIAKIFSVAELSPTYVIGGKVLSNDENSGLGNGKHIVVEADESDGTFIHLQPDVAVITNVDDDHLVHYNNIFENLLDSFVTFLENIPFWGYMVINGDDNDALKVSKKVFRKKITFGESDRSDYMICNIYPKNGTQSFEIFDKNKQTSHKFLINLPGKHNVYNAAASISVALEEQISVDAIREALESFTGVGRRYEKHNIIIDSKDLTLIDDYGHHPIEINANINAIKEEYPGKKLCMIFQPHRYTRTHQLFENFVEVLKDIDYLILIDIYSASEEPIDGISSEAIVSKIEKFKKNKVVYMKSKTEIQDYIKINKDKFDILVTQGAGSISKICESILDEWKT